MAFNVKRGRGRPIQSIKTRSFAHVTPKGFAFTKVDKKNKSFVFTRQPSN